MNFKEVLKMVQAARCGKTDESLDHMLSNFEDLLVLMQDHQELSTQEGSPSEDDLRHINQQLTSSIQKLQVEYSNFCKKNNRCPKEMQEYFRHSNNFSTQAWAQIQEFNRRFGIGDREVSDSQLVGAKIKKIRKKVKKQSKKWAAV